jgi:uncharacterized protein Veg
MNIEQLKEQLQNHIGDTATIQYHLGRNKYENYNVTIKKMYNHIFLVELKEKSVVKSFSYSDILTKTIKIKF